MAPLAPDHGGPDSQHRRWFADPITRVLLAHWHKDGLRNPGLGAEDYLQAFFGSPADDCSDLLLRHARLHWQLRIPPLLVAHALGEHQAVPVPPNDWRRIVGLTYSLEAKPESIRATDKSTHKINKEFTYSLRNILKSAKNTLVDKRYAAAEILQIQSSIFSDPYCLEISQWCIFALTINRGKLSKGLSPSTVQNYFNCLIKEVFEPGDDPRSWSSEQLEECYVNCLSKIEDGSRRNRVLNTIRSFHAYLCSERSEVLPLSNRLEAYRAEGRSSARLLSPDEFNRALALCPTKGHQLCLILSFRAGLRLRETLGLLLSDFCNSEHRCDLVIATNRSRKLKTLTSRRILPLDLLLEAAELKLLRDWIDGRRALAKAVHAVGMFVGPINAYHPVSEGGLLKSLDQILLDATGDELTVHHLRHSFASYLLATLMLPEDSPEVAVPDSLRSAISLERKQKLCDRLLGSEKLGQHALHSVSSLLGHILSSTTLKWYTHLLDLTLQHYVSRSAVEASISLPQVLRLTGQRSAKVLPLHPIRSLERRGSYRRPVPSYSPMDGTPPQGWQVSCSRGRQTKRLERVLRSRTELEMRKKCRQVMAVPLSSPDTDWREIAAEVSAPSEHASPWFASAQSLQRLMLKSGLPRHVPSAFKVSSSAGWQKTLDHHWRPIAKMTAIQRRALFYAVEHWDPARCGVRFRSRPLAVAWRAFLHTAGLENSNIQLSVSGRFVQRQSAELHRLLAISDDLPGTSARRGWRGTIMIGFKGEGDHARQLNSAAHFLILMSAIHAGYRD
jgi:site-specific recombinase XerD